MNSKSNSLLFLAVLFTLVNFANAEAGGVHSPFKRVSCTATSEERSVQIEYTYVYTPNVAPEFGSHIEVQELKISLSEKSGSKSVHFSGDSLKKMQAVDADGVQQLTYKLDPSDSLPALIVSVQDERSPENWMDLNYGQLELGLLGRDEFEGSQLQCTLSL